MTGGALAGMIIADEILGKENPFAKASAFAHPMHLQRLQHAVPAAGIPAGLPTPLAFYPCAAFLLVAGLRFVVCAQIYSPSRKPPASFETLQVCVTSLHSTSLKRCDIIFRMQLRCAPSG